MAYCPLGRSFLTGAYRRPDDLPSSDSRRHHPRFTGENLARNLELVDRISEFADRWDVSAAQVALAWVLARGDDVVPIVGTTRVVHLEHDLGALGLPVPVAALQDLDLLIDPAR